MDSIAWKCNAITLLPLYFMWTSQFNFNIQDFWRICFDVDYNDLISYWCNRETRQGQQYQSLF
jgi:hypothetical protein